MWGTAERGLRFGGRRRQSVLGFFDFAFMFFFLGFSYRKVFSGFVFKW